MLKKVFQYLTGLQGRVILFVLTIILLFTFVLSTIYTFQQERILRDSFEKEISPYLFPVENLVSEMDYYANNLIRLEEYRIKEKEKIKNYIKELEKSPQNFKQTNIKKLKESDFINEKNKQFYEQSKENTIKILKDITKKDLKQDEITTLFQLASSVAIAKLNQNKDQYYITKKNFDGYLQQIFGYKERQKNFFSGLDFNKYRIESINILRWQRFDTKDLSIVKENLPINKISWQEPFVKEPFNIVYNNYNNNQPMLQAYTSQFTYESIPFFLIVKVIYHNPGIYERAIRILQSFESKDKYQWQILIGKLNHMDRKIKEIYKRIKDLEKQNDIKMLYQNNEYRELIQILNDLINNKRNIIEQFSYNLLKKYNSSFTNYIKNKQELELKIKNKQKQLMQYSLENTDARVPIIKEINQLKNELNQIEEEKNQWIFDSNLQLVDAYLYLADNIIYKKIFFEYVYDPNRYTDYIKSKNVRIFYETIFLDIQNWLISPFDKSYLDKYNYRGFFIYDQKEARDLFIDIYTKDLKELATISLIEDTAGFTRILADMRQFSDEVSIQKSNFIDIAIAFGVRVMIISILFSSILIKKIQFIINQILKIGQGKLDIYIPFKGKDEISQLGNSINVMVKGLKEKEELRKELNAAEEIQKRILPSVYPKNMEGNLKIASFYKAMIGVGGDYYDFIEANSDEIVFCIADVSSHGVGPALIMTLLRSRLHSIVKQGNTEPAKIALELNQDLYNETPPEIFVTAFIGSYNKKTSILRFVSSGHLPAIFLRNEKLLLLPSGGLPLAAVNNDLYQTIIKPQKLELKSDDLFILYTDGLTEAMNYKEELFGEDRLKEILIANRYKQPEELIKIITREVEKFTNKKILTETNFSELNDDIAIMIFKKI